MVYHLLCMDYLRNLLLQIDWAIYVNSIFSDIRNANTISLTLGAIFFSYQIYADFSGYSLIARGTAKLLGIDLMINFDRPYLATNIPDFWRRWHISLSTWFRDYVYIPLGGNRVSILRNYNNLILVFLISGLWHGANWTFIIWGGLHGIYQLAYLQIRRFTKFERNDGFAFKILNIGLVHTVVTFSWIFFRAESVNQAVEYLNKLTQFDFSVNLVQLCAEKGPLNLLISLMSIGLLYLSYLLPKNLQFRNDLYSMIFIVMTMLIIAIIGINGETEFIYFQF